MKDYQWVDISEYEKEPIDWKEVTMSLRQLLNQNTNDLDSEIQKAVDKHFWELA